MGREGAQESSRNLREDQTQLCERKEGEGRPATVGDGSGGELINCLISKVICEDGTAGESVEYFTWLLHTLGSGVRQAWHTYMVVCACTRLV